jgi:hypothetical protein
MRSGGIKNKKIMKEEKQFFLKTQFWMSTIQASFSRANIYTYDLVKNKKEHIANDSIKNEFKTKLWELIDVYLIPGYSNSVDVEQYQQDGIEHIKEWSKNYADYLQGGELKIGVCQKLLNLYLKYLWCADMIDFTPPHFPLDRVIQEQSEMRITVDSWTKLDDYEEYKNKIEAVSFLGGDAKALWELKKYNEIIREQMEKPALYYLKMPE